jgi:hypothetical protein
MALTHFLRLLSALIHCGAEPPSSTAVLLGALPLPCWTCGHATLGAAMFRRIWPLSGLRTLVLPRVEILDTLHAPSETRITASNRVR